MIVQLMNPMWLDGLIYLPLICWGVHRLIDEGKMAPYIVPLALMFIAPQLSKVALIFGNWEYFAVALVGLAVVITMAADDLLKGLIGSIIGMVLACVGIEAVSGVQRLTFGNWQLMNGLIKADNSEIALSESLDCIIKTLNSEAGVVWLLDPKDNALHPIFSIGEVAIKDMQVENGMGTEGVVTRDYKPVMVSDQDVYLHSP